MERLFGSAPFDLTSARLAKLRVVSAKLRLIPAVYRAQRSVLRLSHVARIGSSETLQLQVLTDGVVKQSHCAPKPYCVEALSSPMSQSLR